jgi:rfaE bifunctional protein kinase chain/domain
MRLSQHLTPTKSRILGGISHWQRQQIVRVDREPGRPAAPVRRQLSRRVVPLLREASALLVSDYGYGSTSGREVDFLRRRAGGHRLPVTVDSRYDLSSYQRVTAATPNEPELEEVFGVHIENRTDVLHRLGNKALVRQRLEALLLTRGRDGMVLFEPGRPPCALHVFGSDQAVDVTGAGDTVIAAFTVALAAGAGFLHAAMLANIAGGLVVMKRGTATVTSEEIKEAIRNA